jgi:hypothetical protein
MAGIPRQLSQLLLFRMLSGRLRFPVLGRFIPQRQFHDYWVQKTSEGLSLRVPILKARHHLGAMSSRGDRAENEDRFKVGLMNKLSSEEEHQPFYFAIIDGYSLISPN